MAYYRMPVYYPSDEEKKYATMYAATVYDLMLQRIKDVFDSPSKNFRPHKAHGTAITEGSTRINTLNFRSEWHA